MHKKSIIYSVIGTGLYGIALLFLIYAFNHPEGGFIYPFSRLTPTIYYIYLIFMFAALLIGNISSFRKYGNRIQLAGSIVFLVGIILLIIFFIIFVLILRGKTNIGAEIFFIILLSISAILPLPLFVIGSILISKH